MNLFVKLVPKAPLALETKNDLLLIVGQVSLCAAFAQFRVISSSFYFQCHYTLDSVLLLE